MPVTQQQVQNAQTLQHRAAHDPNPQVRLIAGPGTGKSFAIGERVHWLLQRGILPQCIFVVSFTRAASLDLQRRTYAYCKDKGFPNVDQVVVSTLHSLALRALYAANLLAYPAPPLVMDNWELENILDVEFSKVSGYTGRPGAGYTPGRCKEIRRDYEAFCGTGQWVPPNYIPPDPPISGTERADYQGYHRLRTQIYSCVLPGEIVRQCVENMKAGVLDPVTLLGIEHLIVDEYQDLNPIDLDFVDRLISNGVIAFVAGDDDQSVYSFRFASPIGIQSFISRHLRTGDHELRHCFRCTPNVLGAAQALLNTFGEPGRIPKHLVSLYETSEPPESGLVYRWIFLSAVREARAIASSCAKLIYQGGLSPRKIMILVSNTRAQLASITGELTAQNVQFESPRGDSFIDTRAGRFILALLRIACDTNDYVAHRLVLGLRPNVGAGICNSIAEAVIANNLNFRDIFYHPLPTGVFHGRHLSALNSARAICANVSNWLSTDTLTQRSVDICNIVLNTFGSQQVQEWTATISHLPQDITLEELRDYLWADTDEQQASLLGSVYDRLGLPTPVGGLLPDKIRIMTMHGAKGLDGSVVFIPGLMEEILPGDRKSPYPGLVLEAARMLYVSITRARAACILSYAETRIAYGNFTRQACSRFVPHLGGTFVRRDDGLADLEVGQVLQCCNNL